MTERCFSSYGFMYLYIHYCLSGIIDVYKPSRGYVGKFGAILLTYFASSLLHVSSNVFVCFFQFTFYVFRNI